MGVPDEKSLKLRKDGHRMKLKEVVKVASEKWGVMVVKENGGKRQYGFCEYPAEWEEREVVEIDAEPYNYPYAALIITVETTDKNARYDVWDIYGGDKELLGRAVTMAEAKKLSSARYDETDGEACIKIVKIKEGK